jgi:hypothetical protein
MSEEMIDAGAYREEVSRLLAKLAECGNENDDLRAALERLADEDTPVLDSGLGGGPAEELHVRASYAAHALGSDVCGCGECSECMVSLGLGDEEDEEGECECGSPTCRRVSHDEPASARDALDAQTLHDSPGADL